jgi:hypothetical protein
MIKICKVTIITKRNSYIRRIAGSIYNVMKIIDRNLENHRQWIGIPVGEKIIEVKYKEYNEYND